MNAKDVVRNAKKSVRSEIENARRAKVLVDHLNARRQKLSPAI